MLEITIPDVDERFDETKMQFLPPIKGQTIKLEHSLVSIAKWESKYHKPFMSDDEKTTEEMNDYIKCMTITQNANPELYSFIPESEIKKINEYIENPMTAAKFTSYNSKKGGKKIITAETIYYWMISFNIPHEYEKWHINRLMTLIRFFSAKNGQGEKMSKDEIRAQYAEINRRNKEKYMERKAQNERDK